LPTLWGTDKAVSTCLLVPAFYRFRARRATKWQNAQGPGGQVRAAQAARTASRTSSDQARRGRPSDRFHL